jgi:hypothetical protein
MDCIFNPEDETVEFMDEGPHTPDEVLGEMCKKMRGHAMIEIRVIDANGTAFNALRPMLKQKGLDIDTRIPNYEPGQYYEETWLERSNQS